MESCLFSVHHILSEAYIESVTVSIADYSSDYSVSLDFAPIYLPLMVGNIDYPINGFLWRFCGGRRIATILCHMVVKELLPRFHRLDSEDAVYRLVLGEVAEVTESFLPSSCRTLTDDSIPCQTEPLLKCLYCLTSALALAVLDGCDGRIVDRQPLDLISEVAILTCTEELLRSLDGVRATYSVYCEFARLTRLDLLLIEFADPHSYNVISHVFFIRNPSVSE